MSFQLNDNIFMQLAGMKQRQRENTQNSIFDAISKGIQQKQFNQQMDMKQRQLNAAEVAEANDPKALGQSGFMKMARGVEPSPQEQAAMQLMDAQNRVKVTTDKFGNQIRNDSIFDMISAPQMPARGGGDPMMKHHAAVNQRQTQIGANPNANDIQPVDMNEGDVLAAIKNTPRITNEAEKMRYGQMLDEQSLARNEQVKADIALSKKQQEESREQQKADADTLPILQDMLKYNSGTLDIPYAGALQPLIRLQDQGKAENMALLKQAQLGLAAPLAKQLGVNPTDKDFQNTLDQIFNENESKATREKQLKTLIRRIEQRQGKYDPNRQKQESYNQLRSNSEQNRPQLTREQALQMLRERGRIQ